VEAIAARNAHDAFLAHCRRAAAEVETWPEWKRNIFGGLPDRRDGATAGMEPA
jgi:hypothetical protein